MHSIILILLNYFYLCYNILKLSVGIEKRYTRRRTFAWEQIPNRWIAITGSNKAVRPTYPMKYSSKWIKVSQPFPSIPVLHVELSRYLYIFLLITLTCVFQTRNNDFFFFLIFLLQMNDKSLPIEDQSTHSHLNSCKNTGGFLIHWQKTSTTYVQSSYHQRFKRFLLPDWIVRGRCIFCKVIHMDSMSTFVAHQQYLKRVDY